MTFNRMKQLSTDISVIVAAITASDSGIIEVLPLHCHRYNWLYDKIQCVTPMTPFHFCCIYSLPVCPLFMF